MWPFKRKPKPKCEYAFTNAKGDREPIKDVHTVSFNDGVIHIQGDGVDVYINKDVLAKLELRKPRPTLIESGGSNPG